MAVSCSHQSGSAPLARAKGSWKHKNVSTLLINAATSDQEASEKTDLDLLQYFCGDLLTGEFLWSGIKLELFKV